MSVYSGGLTLSDTLESGSFEIVSSGGTASNTTTNSGGYVVVLPGGNLVGTISSGGGVVSTGVVVISPKSGGTVYAQVASGIVVGNGTAPDHNVFGYGNTAKWTFCPVVRPSVPQ